MNGTEPLNQKIMPKTLDDIIENDEIKKILKRWIENKTLHSFILFGPPGSGKTSIVNAFINDYRNKVEDIAFFSISGAIEGSKKLKEILRNEFFGKKKVLFIDEIHRLKRNDQDVILLALERGELYLIGSTTENPSFVLNPALLSRVFTFQVRSLTNKGFMGLIDRIINYYNSKSINVNISNKELLLEYSLNDARRLINLIEMLVNSGYKQIDEKILEIFGVKTGYTKETKYDFISAYIKSVRGSDPDAALLYLTYMLENGEDPMYIARRLVILAAEDIGLADPNALNLAVSAMIATEKIGYPECFLPLSEATIYLASAPKSNSAYLAYKKAKEIIENNVIEVPLKLRNPVTKFMEKMGYGKGYIYPHDYNGFVNTEYMPKELRNEKIYEAKEIGFEKKIKERLYRLWNGKKG